MGKSETENQYSYNSPVSSSGFNNNHDHLYTQQQVAPYTLAEPVRVEPQNITDLEKGRVSGYSNPNSSTAQNGQSSNTLESSQWGDVTGFNDKSIRIGFIRKVYLLLSVQLIFTFGLVLVFVLVEPVKEFAKSDTGFILYLVSYGVFFFLLIFSICLEKRLRQVPWNYGFLTLITLSMTYMLGMVSAYHDVEAVVIAVGITLLITVGVTAFAMQTKFDFTKNCILLAVCLSFALFGFGISCIFVQSDILQAVYGGLGAMVTALFLAIDTQLIIGNKRFSYSPEDYVGATLQLYLDICRLFLYLLTLLGSKK